MKPNSRTGLPGLFLGVLCASLGCDDRTLVIIAVTPVPEGALTLRASLTYDGRPHIAPELIEFDMSRELPNGTATFGARLSPEMNSELVAATGVLNKMWCLLRLGSGSTRAVRDAPRIDITLEPPLNVEQDDLCNPDRTPILLRAVPSVVSSSGNDRVKLLGWDFSCNGGPQVTVRGVAGQSLSCASLSELSFNAPQNTGPVGRVPLTVMNRSGRMSTRSDLLAYYANTLSFDSPWAPYPVGMTPSDLAIGRIDVDDVPDLAVASRDDGKVTVLINDGQGTFPADRTTSLLVGVRPSGVAIGDLDQDPEKKIDLAVTNAADNTVSLLLQSGKMDKRLLFTARPPALVSLSPTAVRMLDLDGDGKLELVVLHRVASDVTVLKKDSLGRYVRGQDYAVGRDPVQLAVGDLNQDGASDLAVISAGTKTLNLLIADRIGGFIGPSSFALTGPASSVALADVDSDGDVDVVAGGMPITILRNDGAGQFTALVLPDLGVAGPVGALALSDLDFDGHPDLVLTAPQEDRVYVLRNSMREQGLGFIKVQGYSVGTRPGALGLADVNGDGLIDIAVANQGDSTVSVLRNQSK